MSWQRSLLVTELDRDRTSRVAKIDLGSKTLLTPNFCPLIQSPMDLEALMLARASGEAVHVGSFIVRMFDANEILPTIRTHLQTDMSGRVITDRISLFLRGTVFAMDPVMEYLYYDSKMQRFLHDPLTPRSVRNYAHEVANHKKNIGDARQYGKTKSRLHKAFWENAHDQSTARNKLIHDVFQVSMRFGVDFLIPPVPLALDERLLEIARRINEVASEVALALGRKHCANYLVLPRSSLSDAHFMDKVKNCVLESSARLSILKFKYLDLTNPRMLTERETYTDLLLDLAYLSKTLPNRAFMILENSYQSFTSAVSGFDVVSSSATGFDGEGGFSEHPTYGSWIDPRLMVHVDFDEVCRIFHNNRERLPCHHEVCGNVKDIETVTPERWNLLRREHCILYYNDCMSQITRAVTDRNIELAREKLVNSQLSSLRGLIPIKG